MLPTQREKDYLTVTFLAEDVRHQRPPPLGVDRFEQALQVFGLSGTVDAQTTNDLLELHQIRNVLVHRRGIADDRLAQACPHLGLTAGDQVAIDTDTFGRYAQATLEYSKLLLQRVANHYGIVR